MNNEHTQNVATPVDDSKQIFRVLLAHLGSGDIEEAKKVIVNHLEKVPTCEDRFVSIKQDDLNEVQTKLHQIHSLSTILDSIGFEYIELNKNNYSNILGNFSELILSNSESAIDLIGEVL